MVNACNRWARSAAAVGVSGAVLGVALFGVTGAAHAQGITNPAQHPAPITVTIDGQTYHDGLDTLPGYDDYACTPIPNVEYAFADDEIQYYSGGELVTTAHWTEWSRISSYDDWVAQQNAGTPTSTPTPTPTPTPTTTSSTSTSSTSTSAAATSPTSAATKTPAVKTHGTVAKAKQPATKTKSSPTSTATKRPASQSTTTSSTPKRATSSHASKSGTPTKRDTVTTQSAVPTGTVAPATGDGTAPSPTPSPDPTSTPSPQTTTKYKLASARTSTGGSAGDTRTAGVAILVALLALAGLAYLFGFANRPDFARRGPYS